eukprot:2874377-Amphidinium_carterae.1
MAIGSRPQVMHRLTMVAEAAMHQLQSIDLPLSPGKTVLLASRDAMAQTLHSRLQHFGFRLAKQHRFLGQEAVIRRSRRTCLQQQRRGNLKRKLRRVRALRQAGGK